MARIHPGPPVFWKSKRTSEPPPIGNRTDLHSCGLWSMTTDFRVRVASIAAMQRSLKPRSTGQHPGDSPVSLLEAEPDKRAGTVSKTDRSASWNGELDLRLPPLHADLAEQPCTRLVNEIRPGQHR